MNLPSNQYQRNSSWNAPYTFSGKEKDEETGYGYFGARYYDSGLSIWLSVDQMSDKYPNLSPYNYCANNPVMLVDPDGRDVEYNSAIDLIIISAFRLTNPKFDSFVRTLENSDELYTFNYNTDGNSSNSYDGRSIIISYCLTPKLADEGSTLNSLLLHETEHAMQFEHGEVVYWNNPDGIWEPFFYDLTDEWKAHNVEYRSNQKFLGPINITNLWGNYDYSSRENLVQNKVQQYTYLTTIERYTDLPNGPINSNTSTTLKTISLYIKPYKPRQ